MILSKALHLLKPADNLGFLAAEIRANRIRDEVTHHDNSGTQYNIKQHFVVVVSSAGIADQETERGETEDAKDGGVADAGFPAVEEVEKKAIEVGGKYRKEVGVQGGAAVGELDFGFAEVGVIDEFSSEPADNAVIVQSQTEDERPRGGSEDLDEEEGEQVFLH